MTVKKNISLLVAFALLGILILGAVSLYLMNGVRTTASYAQHNTVPSLVVLDRMAVNLAESRSHLWQSLSEPSSRSTQQDDRAVLDQALNHYQKELVSDDRDRALMTSLRDSVADYNRGVERYESALNNGDASARNLLIELEAARNKDGNGPGNLLPGI